MPRCGSNGVALRNDWLPPHFHPPPPFCALFLLPMTPPEFSVLLLAWDDADPSVAVLGGAALPPTLPLVYQLAAHRSVLAVYPNLPCTDQKLVDGEAEDSIEQPQAQKPKKTASLVAPEKSVVAPALAAPPNALDSTVTIPGVRLLAGTTEQRSRVIGLNNLTPPPQLPLPAAVSKLPVATATLVPPTAARSQWPTHATSAAGQWQAPVAPYAGAAAEVVLPKQPPVPQPAPPRWVAAAPPSPPALRASATLRPNEHPQAGDLHFDPDPELPALHQPAAFDELTEEPGPAEANDLSTTSDDLMPDTPLSLAARATPVTAAPTPAAAAAAATTAAQAAPVILVPAPDGLNFRMIQYARRAAQLVRGRSDFGVIYAPNWPAWLAALEIRNSSAQPLVLYATGLATDFANPAEHGWQQEIERMTLRRARLILVPDQNVLRQLRAQYGYTIGEVRVVAAADEQAVQRLLAEVAAG